MMDRSAGGTARCHANCHANDAGTAPAELITRRAGIGLAAALCLTLLALAPARAKAESAAGPNSASDRQAIAHLLTDWLEVGWKHEPGSPPFNFKTQLEAYYDWSAPDAYFFDDSDPQKRISRSPAEYGAVWDATLPKLRSLSNKVVSPPDILLSGDLAVATVRYVLTFSLSDGIANQVNELDTVALRREAGGWKIVREHGSALGPATAPADAAAVARSK